jgi:hypothetical protein
MRGHKKSPTPPSPHPVLPPDARFKQYLSGRQGAGACGIKDQLKRGGGEGGGGGREGGVIGKFACMLLESFDR